MSSTLAERRCSDSASYKRIIEIQFRLSGQIALRCALGFLPHSSFQSSGTNRSYTSTGTRHTNIGPRARHQDLGRVIFWGRAWMSERP